MPNAGRYGIESQGVRKTTTWGELAPIDGGGNPTRGHLGTPLQLLVAVPEERQGARPQLVQFAP